MHELTLLFGIAEKVEKTILENNIDHVDAVVIEVGEISSVIPEFLMDGYEVVSDEYDFLRGSELIIHKVKAVAQCLECGEEYEIVENEGQCPNCGSYDKEILAGREFVVKEIRVLET